MAKKIRPDDQEEKKIDLSQVEEPDFEDEDEEIMNRVWARIHAGESLDEIIGEKATDSEE